MNENEFIEEMNADLERALVLQECASDILSKLLRDIKKKEVKHNGF